MTGIDKPKSYLEQIKDRPVTPEEACSLLLKASRDHTEGLTVYDESFVRLGEAIRVFESVNWNWIPKS